MKKFRIESMSGPNEVSQEVIEAKTHQHALQQLVEKEERSGVFGTGGFCHLDPKNGSYPKDAITVVLTVWETDEDDETDGFVDIGCYFSNVNRQEGV